MNTQWISPNDMPGETDSERIQNAIDQAAATGTGQVIIPRHNKATGQDLWSIDRTLRLPSKIEILIDGAHLQQADNTFCQMFATENYFDPAHPAQEDIILRGQNGAVLDGGNYNGLSEATCKQPGMPHIRCNTMLLFYHVSGLVVSDLKIMRQRWWGITNLFVSNARFGNLLFQADLSRIDENGVHHPDEAPRTYQETYVKNADGIDLRLGCHHITIENIRGFTEDDTVALTALSGFETEYLVPGQETDIHHITVQNVEADCYYTSLLRLLCSKEHRIHHITAKHLKDTRTTPAYQATATVRLGDVDYTDRYADADNIYEIAVDQVTSKALYAVSVCNGVTDASFTNLKAAGEAFHVFQHARLMNVEISLAE